MRIKTKCIPGVVCFENVTLGFFLLIFGLISYFFFFQKKSILHNPISFPSFPSFPSFFPSFFPSLSPYSPPPVPGDVLRDPYVPPLKDERYILTEQRIPLRGAVPINIQSNIGAVDTSFRQIGILTPISKQHKDNILPLIGRPVFTNRDKWQYYTIGNQFNSVKLPILFKGRSAMNEYGVDSIYQGDTVYIEGLGESYKATVYDNDTMRYLPFV